MLRALAAAAEPELADLLASVDRDRLDGLRRFVGMLERGGPLRVDADAAAETVWALANPELHRMLWSGAAGCAGAACDWLSDTLAEALLP